MDSKRQRLKIMTLLILAAVVLIAAYYFRYRPVQTEVINTNIKPELLTGTVGIATNPEGASSSQEGASQKE